MICRRDCGSNCRPAEPRLVYRRGFLVVGFEEIVSCADCLRGAGEAADARHSVIHRLTLNSGLACRRDRAAAAALLDGIDNPRRNLRTFR